MYYFIYKTVNLVNGRYYYGAHSTEDLNDNYYGSGVVLTKAVNKYGLENFVREILAFYDSEEALYEAEKSLVNENVLKDPMCYNLNTGGHGGFFHLREKLSGIIKNKWKNKVYRNTISEKAKKYARENPGKIRELLDKANMARVEKLRTDAEYSRMFGSKISSTLKKFWSEASEEYRKGRGETSRKAFSEERRTKLRESCKGYKNPDFIKRWKPLYDSFLEKGIIDDILDPSMLDRDIVKKYGGGFNSYRVFNYYVYLGLLEFVEKRLVKENRILKLKTFFRRKDENANKD